MTHWSIKNKIKYVWFAHILNPIWLPRVTRRNKRFNVKYSNTKKGLLKYKNFIESLVIDNTPEFEPNPEEFIFSIWFQSENEAPPLVKACFRRLRLFYGEKVKILDSVSLKEVLNLPEYIWEKWEKGIITNAHFSDICRIELLYQYGGMWFDATDYMTSPVPDWIIELDLFMFASGNTITPTTLVQSCFIRARQKNPLLGAWRQFIFEYWKNENRLLDYFLLHYMLRYMVENNKNIAALFIEMPIIDQDSTHVLWYKHRDDKYSPQLYTNATKDSFFQKTNFKMKSALKPISGSIAEHIINS